MEGEQMNIMHSEAWREKGGQEVNDAKHPLGTRLAMILARE